MLYIQKTLNNKSKTILIEWILRFRHYHICTIFYGVLTRSCNTEISHIAIKWKILIIPIPSRELKNCRQLQFEVDRSSMFSVFFHLYHIRLPIAQRLLIACDIYIAHNVVAFYFDMERV